MKKSVNTLLFLSLALPVLIAQAQIFMCKDAAGKTYSSDRPIPECADRPVREFGLDGTIRREIPAPPTAEEKRQKKLQEENHKAEALAAEEQMNSDRVILARYANEKDIEAARKRSLDLVQDQVKREEVSVAAAEKQLKELRAEMESYKKKTAAIPTDLRRRIEESGQAVENGNRTMQGSKAEMAQIEAKYDKTLKRYRQISGPTGAKKFESED
jgi:hypothetical protein